MDVDFVAGVVLPSIFADELFQGFIGGPGGSDAMVWSGLGWLVRLFAQR